jgi:hypothetical protein
MFARIAIAAVSVVSLASVASAGVRVIPTGSHNPAQGYIVVNEVAVDRPYTLAGSERARQHNATSDSSIRVGNRVVVPTGQR